MSTTPIKDSGISSYWQATESRIQV